VPAVPAPRTTNFFTVFLNLDLTEHDWPVQTS
jgi:hypothetical protein